MSRVLVFTGSARSGSLNGLLATTAARHLTAAGAEVTEANLRDFPVPLYDFDVQTAEGVPAHAARLAALIAGHDALVIASPEYNASLPGPVKNLLDWVSRVKPWVTTDVPVLLLAAGPGRGGGRRGQDALRLVLEAVGARVHEHGYVLPLAGESIEDGVLRGEADERLAALTREFLAAVPVAA
ncbi:oxidoreductase [Actinorhabdospora filicis]|uniref:Oxidoreductase n=1 Tax=Actinorhabdospora filicis TaxID=1785913 RepID=A0A9W6SDY7_9ACTN|nr:NAD(P)H-dependent oxidoreductase [Actinorhabdospora filicis]GLZ75464.1 oxidoreductase [Actinorhabdospora filicis]